FPDSICCRLSLSRNDGQQALPRHSLSKVSVRPVAQLIEQAQCGQDARFPWPISLIRYQCGVLIGAWYAWRARNRAYEAERLLMGRKRTRSTSSARRSCGSAFLATDTRVRSVEKSRHV